MALHTEAGEGEHPRGVALEAADYRPDGVTPARPRRDDDWWMDVSITVARAISPEVAASLGDLEVLSETIIGGELADQAALHGVLTRLRRLGISVLDVQIAP